MLETYPITNIFAVVTVVTSIAILSYFAWKTLITANLFQKGVNLYQAQEYESAEAIFRQLIAINSTNDLVRLLLGDILSQGGNIEEAKELFVQVIRRSPKNADAYLRLANILMRQNQQAEARENLLLARDLCQKQRQHERAAKIVQVLEKFSK